MEEKKNKKLSRLCANKWNTNNIKANDELHM